MNLKQQRAAAIKVAQDLLAACKAEGRELTPAEVTLIEAKHREVEDLTAKIEMAEKSAPLLAAFAAMGHESTGPTNGEHGRFSGRKAVAGIAPQMLNPATKALASSGSAVSPLGLNPGEPIPMGRVTHGLLNVIPTTVVPDPPTFSYLRQSSRTINAAPVAMGGTKPVSTLGLTRKDDRLRVIAHRSEPVDKFMLADLATLQTFVDAELGYGLEAAVESEILNGDGTGEHLTGILNTSGVQTQAWSTDGFETIRKGMTKLHTIGAGSPVVVLNPLDHEGLDLTRTTDDAFLANTHSTAGTGMQVNSPLGGNPLAAWGLPIVLTLGLPAGTGLLMDPDAVLLHTDGTVSVEWNPWSGFATNEVQARCEGRFGLGVLQPAHIVVLDLAP